MNRQDCRVCVAPLEQ